MRRHQIINHDSLLEPEDVTESQTSLIRRGISELIYNTGWYQFHADCKLRIVLQYLYNVLESVEMHFQVDTLLITITTTINTTHIALCLLAPRPSKRFLFFPKTMVLFF